MNTDALVPVVGPEPDASLPALAPSEIVATRGYVEASRAVATRKAYEGEWRRFGEWCRERGATALPAPPALVAVYLSGLATAGKAPPTVACALAAIAHNHKRAGLVPPHRAEGGTVISDALAGIRRSRTEPPDRKAAADADVVFRLLLSIKGDGLAELRDRALIALLDDTVVAVRAQEAATATPAEPVVRELARHEERQPSTS